VAEEPRRAESDVRGLFDEAELLSEAVFDTLHESLLLLESDLRIRLANHSFYRTFQVQPVETVGRHVYELGNGQWNIPRLRHLLDDILPHNHSFEQYEVKHDFPGMAEELGRYLRGWIGYFGQCQTPSVLQSLEEWTRRRLRSVIWKQWKRGSVRFAELRKRGVSYDLAARTAGSAHGPWRLANSPALAFALPNAYFDSLGIPRLTGGR
jgi:Group II intron, maturase-specific domain